MLKLVILTKIGAPGPWARRQKKTADFSAVVSVATRVGVEPTFEVIGFVLALIVGLLQVAVSLKGELLVPLVMVSAVVALANLEEGHSAYINLNVQAIELLDSATASGANYFTSF